MLVFNGMKPYQAQLFILPKKHTREIASICKRFLWTTRNEQFKKKAPIAWKTVGLSVAYGGLNLKQFSS